MYENIDFESNSLIIFMCGFWLCVYFVFCLGV